MAPRNSEEGANAGGLFHDGNLRTMLALFQIAILIFGGGVAYSTIRSTQSQLSAEIVRIEREAEEDRAASAAREVRLRAVELGAGRMEQQLSSIASGIERLNAQMDQILNQYRNGGPPL